MAADWIFWVIAALFAAACLGIVLAPVLRGAGRGEARASYDLRMHRDQLRELDADVTRGVMSAGEADATRIEISRRLLAAAEAEAAEPAGATSPRRLARRLAPALGLTAGISALALYAFIGAPGLPDRPLAERRAEVAAEHARRPAQAEAERLAAEVVSSGRTEPRAEDAALLARLQEALKDRPDDLRGYRLLAQSLAALGRWPEARVAEERVLAILGDRAEAKDYVDLAEMRILAAGGYVSPEAEEALTRALSLDPKDPVGRYYSALALMQGGRPDLAYRIFSGLTDEGPADAPWIAPSRQGLVEAASLAGLPAPAGPGPDAGDVAAAESLPAAERQTMIEGMVGRLSDRLAAEGGPPEDWARLIRSLGVLGRLDEAKSVLAEARAAHGADPAALALIETAGREAGIGP